MNPTIGGLRVVVSSLPDEVHADMVTVHPALAAAVVSDVAVKPLLDPDEFAAFVAAWDRAWRRGQIHRAKARAVRSIVASQRFRRRR